MSKQEFTVNCLLSVMGSSDGEQAGGPESRAGPTWSTEGHGRFSREVTPQLGPEL